MKNEFYALSSVLNNNDYLSVSSSTIKIFPNTADIWNFIGTFYKAYRKLPEVETVIERFPDFVYADKTPEPSKFYFENLKNDQMARDLVDILKKTQGALNTGQPIDKIYQKITSEMSNASREFGVSRTVDIRDSESALSHYDKVREMSALHDGRPGIATGFKYIDDNYPTGLAAGHLVVLFGYSGNFKSWVGLKIMINAWMQGYSPMIINLEMSPEELRDRIYFLISKYSSDSLAKADFEVDEFKSWLDGEVSNRPPFHIIGNETFGEFTLDMVNEKIEQHKPDILMMDYMQLFSDGSGTDNEVIRAKRTGRGSKQLATAANIPVIAISAVSGKDKKDRLNPPEIAQLAFSSEIEYAANLGIAVHAHRNPDGSVKSIEIICRKNRHGNMFDFHIMMDQDGVITEIDPDDMMEIWNPEDEVEGFEISDDIDI